MTITGEPGDLIPQFAFGDARGAKKPPRPLVLNVARPLGLEDIDQILDLENSIPAAAQAIKKITHSHHNLAQLLAKGEDEQIVSLITGYQQAYISKLKGDPAFKELLAYYERQTKQVFVDVLERMRSLGLSTIDELQDRLAEQPERFSNRELMEMTKLLLVDPLGGAGSSRGQQPAQSGGPQINIKFVQNNTPAPGPENARPVGPLLHLDAEDIA